MPTSRLLGLAALPISTSAAAQIDPSHEVTVVGVRIKDYERALADCIARHCPPSEEIAASLALSNQHFKDGDYQAARTTLLKARARNARYAKQYPVPVSNLHHANSLVAGVLGLDRIELSSAIEAVKAIKAGIPDEDPRVFMEQLELADAFTRSGRTQDGEHEYGRIAERAQALGLTMVEAEALLRQATLEVRRATRDPALYSRSAQQAIDRVTSLADPAAASAARTARTLQVQLAGINGQDIEPLIARYTPLPAGTPPVLLYAPLITPQHLSGREGQINTNNVSRMATENFDGQWIDMDFLIGRDGRVSDVHVSRQGKRVGGDWAEQITRGIAGRRYAPQTFEARVQERYTYTSNWTSRSGSRIPVRSPNGRLERSDLN